MATKILLVLLLLALLLSNVVAQKQKPRSTAKVADVTTTVGKVFKSTDGRFTVVFPSDPMVEKTTINTAIGQLTSNIFILEKDLLVYYVSYTDLPVGPTTPEETTQALDASRDQLISNGHSLISDTEVTIEGLSAREWLAEKEGVTIRGRAFYDRQRLYQLVFSIQTTRAFHTRKSSADPANRTDVFEKSSVGFFDSFKLTK